MSNSNAYAELLIHVANTELGSLYTVDVRLHEATHQLAYQLGSTQAPAQQRLIRYANCSDGDECWSRRMYTLLPAIDMVSVRGWARSTAWSYPIALREAGVVQVYQFIPGMHDEPSYHDNLQIVDSPVNGIPLVCLARMLSYSLPST